MTIRSIHKFCGAISPVRRVLFCSLCLSLCTLQSGAQFAPVVGYPGTTAIPWDSSAFVGWAIGCTVQKGPMCIASPGGGDAAYGDSAAALGPATQNGVVSLGDGGVAILTFASPIIDGPGFDFAVFENGFNTGPPGFAFLELGFVEVSSDGQRYVRFPAISNVQDTFQLGLLGMDGSLLNNLAGKYIYGYGTPFDLNELIDSPGLDVNNITHVRIIDVVGSIDPVYGTRDSRGHIINDPYPTDYASCGFDLDAVGVIHQPGTNGISQLGSNSIAQVYPNPFSDFIQINTIQSGPYKLQLTDISGRIILEETFEQATRLRLDALPQGVYNIRITNSQSIFSKLIVKE
jgi:hypothetical protein